MSLVSDARTQLRPAVRWALGRPRVLRGGVGIVVLSLLAVAALWPSHRGAMEPVPLVRGDLVLCVDVEGELEAVRSREIGAPPVAEVEFKIAFLAPEGAEVDEDDPVLRFDTEALDRLRAQKRAEYEEAKTKVEQKTLDLQMKLLDLEEQIAKATVALGKARLKTEVPVEVQQRLEYEKAVLEERGRERDLENLDAEARPDFDLEGRVACIGRTVQRRSRRTPLKGFRVEISLGKTDPTFMRPAMRFRGEIETDRISELLLVPRGSVFLRDRGPVVWVRGRLGWHEVDVKLGRSNQKMIEVLEGPPEGARVSPVDLAAPSQGGGGAVAG